MAKGNGSTRASSSSAPKGLQAPSGGSLPAGWRRDSISNNLYHTNIRLNDEAVRSLVDVYGTSVSFGSTSSGTSIRATNLATAQEVMKNGQVLSMLYDGLRNSSDSASTTMYLRAITTQTENMKKKK